LFAITAGAVWGQDTAICEGLKAMQSAYGDNLMPYLSDKGEACLEPKLIVVPEGPATLTSDTRGQWHILPNPFCTVTYRKVAEDDNRLFFIVRVFESNSPRLLYNSAGVWAQMQGGDLGKTNDGQHYRLMTTSVTGTGPHEFILEAPKGVGRFTVYEEQNAIYIIDVSCPGDDSDA